METNKEMRLLNKFNKLAKAAHKQAQEWIFDTYGNQDNGQIFIAYDSAIDSMVEEASKAFGIDEDDVYDYLEANHPELYEIISINGVYARRALKAAVDAQEWGV